MASTDGLAELVAGIRAGREEAGVAFCVRYQAGVRQLVRHRLGTGPDAQDCVQEILLRALHGVCKGSLREPDCLNSFVRSIGIHTAAEFVGQRVLARSQHDPDDPPVQKLADERTASAEARVLHRERVRSVERVLAQLPPRYREILVRAYLKEQDHEQISKEMHLSDGQVRLVKLRARRKVQERLRLRH